MPTAVLPITPAGDANSRILASPSSSEQTHRHQENFRYDMLVASGMACLVRKRLRSKAPD